MTEAELIDAHNKCSRHRPQVLSSTTCGCFFCLKTFSPQDIKEWIRNENTALCPLCGIDSVLGDADIPITPEMLSEMYARWF